MAVAESITTIADKPLSGSKQLVFTELIITSRLKILGWRLVPPVLLEVFGEVMRDADALGNPHVGPRGLRSR